MVIDLLIAHNDVRNSDGSGSIDHDEFLQIPHIASNPLALRMIAIFDEECVAGLVLLNRPYFSPWLLIDRIIYLLIQRQRDGRLPRIRRWVECVQQPRWPRRKVKMYVDDVIGIVWAFGMLF